MLSALLERLGSDAGDAYFLGGFGAGFGAGLGADLLPPTCVERVCLGGSFAIDQYYARTTPMRKQFETFKSLPEDLQKEALREGDLRLASQLAIATSADQRALTWGGFLIAAATASLGGGIALLTKTSPDITLSALALVFAAAILRAAWLAISTVVPASFALPGNHPASWLPNEWECNGTDERKIAQARAEQADHLDVCINENREYAEMNGRIMRHSFRWALWTLVVGASAFGVILAYRIVIMLACPQAATAAAST